MAGAARPRLAGGGGRRTPLGRLGRDAQVAEAVLALHRLGWVTGHVEADGGLSLTSPIAPPGFGVRS